MLAAVAAGVPADLVIALEGKPVSDEKVERTCRTCACVWRIEKPKLMPPNMTAKEWDAIPSEQWMCRLDPPLVRFPQDGLRSEHDVAQIGVCLGGATGRPLKGERQHVGGHILAAIGGVESLHQGVIAKHDRGLAACRNCDLRGLLEPDASELDGGVDGAETAPVAVLGEERQ